MKKTILAILFGIMLFAIPRNVSAQQPVNYQAQDDSTYMTIISDSTTVDGTRIVNYRPSPKVCSKNIEIHVKDGVITFAQFTKGCSGNTQGVCVLIKGMKVQDAIDKLDGILCGRRGTSCPDQLATALKLL